jgi:hypothetical protein
MDIDTIKEEARKLARDISLKDRDVDDSVAAMRLRLRSKVVKLFPDAERPERQAAKGQDDAAERVNALIEEVYTDAARHAFETDEEITPEVVLREVSMALDHIERVKGIAFFQSAILRDTKAYLDKRDLRSVDALLYLMPELRKQVVNLRSNYAITHGDSGRFLEWKDGWRDVIAMLDYVDFCMEFLEQEKDRLKSVPMAA